MKKNNLQEIDESLLLSSINPQRESSTMNPVVQSNPKENENVPTPTKKLLKKEHKMASYENRFDSIEFKERKSVYISKRTHDTVVKILKVIPDKNITVGAYIDCILQQHFEDNKESINELNRRRRDDLI